MRKIPRTMSTQHPDNAATPFFAESRMLEGDDEVQEAYYVYSHLGIEEQMWDCEGKEIDNYVVKKLLTRYPYFFQQNRLGADLFLTIRVPNPSVEKDEAKFMIETLESIPRSFDTARLFYQDEIAPVFEVILPMTTSFEEIDMLYDYYRRYVAGKAGLPVGKHGRLLKEWVGEIKPEKIEVIPLVETYEALLDAHRIAEQMIESYKLPYVRVFLARSDPALNYGFTAASLLMRVALQRLGALEERTGVPVFPIIGMGSAPFRGLLTPQTVEDVLREFPGCQTFTIQSAFKYDNPVVEVIDAIGRLNDAVRKRQPEIDEAEALALSERARLVYIDNVKKIAQIVNRLSAYVPARRMRKLHIGLFGYARSVGGLSLPRAITYCAVLYSTGFPPELLDVAYLSESERERLYRLSPYTRKAVARACSLFNPHSLELYGKEFSRVAEFAAGFDTDREHQAATTRVIDAIKSGQDDALPRLITDSAFLRRFLG